MVRRLNYQLAPLAPRSQQPAVCPAPAQATAVRRQQQAQPGRHVSAFQQLEDRAATRKRKGEEDENARDGVVKGEKKKRKKNIYGHTILPPAPTRAIPAQMPVAQHYAANQQHHQPQMVQTAAGHLQQHAPISAHLPWPCTQPVHPTIPAQQTLPQYTAVFQQPFALFPTPPGYANWLPPQFIQPAQPAHQQMQPTYLTTPLQPDMPQNAVSSHPHLGKPWVPQPHADYLPPQGQQYDPAANDPFSIPMPFVPDNTGMPQRARDVPELTPGPMAPSPVVPDTPEFAFRMGDHEGLGMGPLMGFGFDGDFAEGFRDFGFDGGI